MKIVFDVLGSTENSGGMRLHSTEMINAWLDLYPEDAVAIVGPAWTEEEFSPRANVHLFSNENPLKRSFGQLVFSAWVARKQRADALVSLSPIVSPATRKTSVCFQHDWRHKLNPHEFPRIQRLYRKLWIISAKRADINVCISLKAERETLKYAPGSRTVVVPNGYDHARLWGAVTKREQNPTIVTFGHHNNKRPELMIDALPAILARHRSTTQLIILGARGRYAQDLKQRAKDLGVDANTKLPGFVSDEEYQRTIANASLISMPSSDEGFGLPIAEAIYLGIPALVTKDSGMVEIFGENVTAADATVDSIASHAIIALGKEVVTVGEANLHSWSRAASQLRQTIHATLESSHAQQ
ncbi:glycosyltransferase [Microbacterium keratanolyticum]